MPLHTYLETAQAHLVPLWDRVHTNASVQFLQIWLGLALLDVAFGTFRSWLKSLRFLTPAAFAMSCWYLWGHQGGTVMFHTWLTAGCLTTGLGALVLLLSVVSDRVANWSVFSIFTAPLLWPFQLSSGLAEVIRFFYLLPAVKRQPARGLKPADSQELPCPAFPMPERPAQTMATAGTTAPLIEGKAAAGDAAQIEFRLVRAAEFGHLDLTFYDQTSAALEAHHFTRLSDTEIVVHGSSTSPRILMRTLRSPDHCVIATLHHRKSSMWAGLRRMLGGTSSQPEARVVEFTTEFEDGSFVITSSDASYAGETASSMVNRAALPDRPLLEIGHEHYQRLALHGTRRHTHPRHIYSIEDEFAMARRQHAVMTREAETAPQRAFQCEMAPTSALGHPAGLSA